MSSNRQFEDLPKSNFAGLERLAEIASEPPANIEEQLWTDEEIQVMFAKLIKMYACRFEKGDRMLPFDPETTGATSVLITATMMLKAARIELFELGMWQAFSGVK